MSTSETRHDTTGSRARPLMPVMAALLGLGLGLVFGTPFLTYAERFWTGFLLPAYLEIQKSGIPFCG